MTDQEKAFKNALEGLHAIEHDLELANALTPHDYHLNEAELILHKAISEIERASKGLAREFDSICLTDSYGCRR